MPKKTNLWAAFLALLAGTIIPNPTPPPPVNPPSTTVVESHIQYVQKSAEFASDDYGKSIFRLDEQTGVAEQEILLSEQEITAFQEREFSTVLQDIKTEIQSILNDPKELISLVADVASLVQVGRSVILFVLEKHRQRIKENPSNLPNLSLPPNPFFDEYYQKAISILNFYKEFKSEPKLTTAVLSSRTGIPKDELETMLQDLGFVKSGHYWKLPLPTDEVIHEAKRLYRKRQLKEVLGLFRAGNIIKLSIIALEVWMIYNIIFAPYPVMEKIGATVLLVIVLLVTIFFLFFVIRE